MAEAMDSGVVEEGQEAFRTLCTHYRRGCSLVSPCCQKIYPCRLCHNDLELSHQIDRRAVTKVECRRCNTRQPVSNTCNKCGLKFGSYFCEICRLYDDEEKGQFHCDGCGLCRVGGRDNFFHCSKCGLCLPHSMRDNHACRQAASKDNCPVCFEDIHSSTNSAHIPHCGHLIHTTCYSQLLRKGIYQCPQCQTSLPNMSSHWAQMDRERDSWVMPKHLKDFKVKVKCRDCHKDGEACYHVVGLKCPSCGSYNTVRCGDEEMPVDADMGGLLDQLLQQRRRRRRRRRREQRNRDGETSSSTDSESEEENNHGNQHRSDSEDGEDPGNQSRPRNTQNHHGNSPRGNDPAATSEGGDPTNQQNDEDNGQNYDGDASENDDMDSGENSSSEGDSDSDYYGAQRSRTFVSFGHRGYSIFLTPIEVPMGTEPGALEWWQDTNDSEDDRDQAPPTHSPPDDSRLLGREEIDGGRGHTSSRNGRGAESHHNNIVPDLEELNSPREMRRRAIAENIVRNMQLWNSDSESFSELSSEEGEEEEEEKSSASWVTEEEEVMIGVAGSDLPQEEAELGINENNNYRDIPMCVVSNSHSESGVESAESWFTSSDNSHSQVTRPQNELCTDSPPTATTAATRLRGPPSDGNILIGGPASTLLAVESPSKTERDSVCSSTSTDDSLAWETACEDLTVC